MTSSTQHHHAYATSRVEPRIGIDNSLSLFRSPDTDSDSVPGLSFADLLSKWIALENRAELLETVENNPSLGNERSIGFSDCAEDCAKKQRRSNSLLTIEERKNLYNTMEQDGNTGKSSSFDNKSDVHPIPPHINFHRRGSDCLSQNTRSGGLKNHRSRSVMIKLQVPPNKVGNRLPSPLSAKRFHTMVTSSPEVRERSQTFSGESPSFSHKSLQKDSPSLSYDDDDVPDEVLASNGPPPPIRVNSVKRNSFLYLSDTDEPHPFSKLASSRTPSITHSAFSGTDEVYITPFAQILVNLQQIRNQFILLTNPPISEERRKKYLPSLIEGELSEDEQKCLSVTVLDELDSCLHRLETVNSAKSMGTMAQDKFRRILSRELSHMSERSKSGHFVAEWVNNLTGSSLADYDEIDRTLDTLIVMENSSTKHLKKRAISVVDEIPRFGISGPTINYDAIQEFYNNNLNEWNFDAFKWNFLTCDQPLVALSYAVFNERRLFSEFKISKQKFINFMQAVQGGYWSQNQYHNAIHAADVLHATNYLLGANALDSVFTDLEIMATLISAAIHDVDHPGRNNQFLINTSHDLAIMYNDDSVLENHHLAVTFRFLKESHCNFLENLEPAQVKAFRRLVIQNVLATDMAKHYKHMGELKTKVETKKVANEGILLLDKFQDRVEVLQCLMHCADLSNPAKTPSIASDWAYRIVEENCKQGDEERRLGIDIGPLGDRENVCIEKCQVSFIDFVIYPLWETWAELVYPDAQLILDHIGKTREYWSGMVTHSPVPTNDTPVGDDKNSEVITSPQTPIATSSVDREDNPINKKSSVSSSSLDDIVLLSPLSLPASERRDSYKATKKMQGIDQSLTASEQL